MQPKKIIDDCGEGINMRQKKLSEKVVPKEQRETVTLDPSLPSIDQLYVKGARYDDIDNLRKDEVQSVVTQATALIRSSSIDDIKTLLLDVMNDWCCSAEINAYLNENKNQTESVNIIKKCFAEIMEEWTKNKDKIGARQRYNLARFLLKSSVKLDVLAGEALIGSVLKEIPVAADDVLLLRAEKISSEAKLEVKVGMAKLFEARGFFKKSSEWMGKAAILNNRTVSHHLLMMNPALQLPAYRVPSTVTDSQLLRQSEAKNENSSSEKKKRYRKKKAAPQTSDLAATAGGTSSNNENSLQAHPSSSSATSIAAANTSPSMPLRETETETHAPLHLSVDDGAGRATPPFSQSPPDDSSSGSISDDERSSMKGSTSSVSHGSDVTGDTSISTTPPGEPQTPGHTPSLSSADAPPGILLTRDKIESLRGLTVFREGSKEDEVGLRPVLSKAEKRKMKQDKFAALPNGSANFLAGAKPQKKPTSKQKGKSNHLKNPQPQFLLGEINTKAFPFGTISQENPQLINALKTDIQTILSHPPERPGKSFVSVLQTVPTEAAHSLAEQKRSEVAKDAPISQKPSTPVTEEKSHHLHNQQLLSQQLSGSRPTPSTLAYYARLNNEDKNQFQFLFDEINRGAFDKFSEVDPQLIKLIQTDIRDNIQSELDQSQSNLIKYYHRLMEIFNVKDVLRIFIIFKDFNFLGIFFPQMAIVIGKQPWELEEWIEAWLKPQLQALAEPYNEATTFYKVRAIILAVCAYQNYAIEVNKGESLDVRVAQDQAIYDACASLTGKMLLVQNYNKSNLHKVVQEYLEKLIQHAEQNQKIRVCANTQSLINPPLPEQSAQTPQPRSYSAVASASTSASASAKPPSLLFKKGDDTKQKTKAPQLPSSSSATTPSGPGNSAGQ